MPAWSFVFDHAQRRHSRLRIGIALGGEDLLYDELSSGVWCEPVTKSLMLRPRVLYPDWDTSNSGAYAKLGFTDFGSPAGIVVADQSGNGSRPFLTGANNIDLITTASWPKNQGFVVSYLAYSNGEDNRIVLECGWNGAAGVSDATAVRVYASGRAEVWREGVLMSTGSISGGSAPSNTANQTVTLMIIPCRRRELLVVSTSGAGFRAVFGDIDEDATDPTITPADQFWVRQPDVSTNILVAPLRYATSGEAYSVLYSMGEAPDVSDVAEEFGNAAWAGGTDIYRLFGDQSYMTGNSDAGTCSLANDDGSAFTPDGTIRDCRLKIALSGDGDSSPVIYGAEMGFAPASVLTDDSEEFDATEYVSSCSFELPDGGGATAFVEFIQHPDLLAGVASLKTQCNRPFRISCEGTTIMNGRLSPPSYKETHQPLADRVRFEVVTTIQALKNYKLRDLKPFDGMLLSHATDDCVFRWCLKQVGVQDSAMDLETSAVRVGETAPATCGEWNEAGRVGESLWEIMERLIEDNLGGWFYDVVPKLSGADFVVCSQATLEGTAVVGELYTNEADAIAGAVDPADTWKHKAREIDVQVVAPESNEVIITGFDPRGRKAIGAIKRDYDSQDATLAPSARPDNWLGEPALLGIINAGITNQTLADGAADVVAARIFVTRHLKEVECEMQWADEDNGVPLWRGHGQTLNGTDYLVQSLSVQLVSIATGFEWAPARMVLSNVVGSTAGKTARQIAMIEKRKREDRVIQRRNSRQLGNLVRGVTTVVP